MPRSRVGRIATGSALVVGGTLGFLPILGFWMVPLVLSCFPTICRRFAAGGGGWQSGGHRDAMVATPAIEVDNKAQPPIELLRPCPAQKAA